LIVMEVTTTHCQRMQRQGDMLVSTLAVLLLLPAGRILASFM